MEIFYAARVRKQPETGSSPDLTQSLRSDSRATANRWVTAGPTAPIDGSKGNLDTVRAQSESNPTDAKPTHIAAAGNPVAGQPGSAVSGNLGIGGPVPGS